MSHIDIKDRIADGDDIFRVEVLGNDKIRLIPEPKSVTEKGTPINKQLLQPLVDAQNVVDISDDFCTDATNGVIKSAMKQIYKMGNIIFGQIECDFTEQMEAGTGVVLEGVSLFNLNEKYAPLAEKCVASSFAIVEKTNAEYPADYVWASVMINQYDINCVILGHKVHSILMYFSYICKGDEDNDN